MKEYVKQKVLKLNLFTFLFFPTIVLYVFNNNIKVITYTQLFKPILLSVLFSFFVYYIFKIVIKNKAIQILLSFEFVLFITIYGIQYNILEILYYKGFWPFSHIHRYLILFQFFVFLLSFLFLKKYKLNYIKIVKGINLIISFLFIYNLLFFHYNYIVEFTKSKTSKHNNQKQFSVNHPNIYYFILDGYASSNVLKKYYSYSNSKFLESLKNKKFKIIDSSYSNYYSTNLSISATLNMDLNKTQNIYNNSVFEIFKKNNYQINIIKSGYSVTGNIKNADLIIIPKGLNEIERTLLDLTIFKVDDVLGNSLYNRIKSQLDLIDELPLKGNNLNFVHIVSPHPPFVFDENGNKTTNIKTSTNYWQPNFAYINQLKYISKRIDKSVSKIIEKDPKSIIIIQSDHGPIINSKNTEELFEGRKYILNCIYAPDKLFLNYSKTKSPVNTFIHLYNFIYNKRKELKKDLTIGKDLFLNEVRINKIVHEK